MADERIEDISGGELSLLEMRDRLVVLDASDTRDDPDGTTKWMFARTIAGLFRGGLIDGLITSNNQTDAAKDIDIKPGVATVTDGTNWTMAELSATITKRLDASWSSGSGNGMLDGTESVAGTPDANTWYHLYLILRSDTGGTDILASESATSPTLPINYDYRRRIGAVRTDGSANIVAYTQKDDTFRWAVAVGDVNANNSGTSAVLRTLTVPLGVKVKAVMYVSIDDGTYQTSTNWLITDPDQSDSTPNFDNTTIRMVGFDDSKARHTGTEAYVYTNTSSQVRSRASASTADHFFRICTHGWIDPRGRNIA